ncbi:hypothetical protein HYN43_029430 [Mucilaginibacter celer]|uniref:Uncharacterized protein n=1 Tax=Mucilaginibacter celer TaxID=2305508 RepID=A0A494VYD8_9SPHI|nr:hypothetical protein HYN43_029430 [Mucilaginibacter celer]
MLYAEKIAREIDNLLNKPIKFSPYCSEITIKGKSQLEFYRVTMKNQGIEILPPVLERIFDKAPDLKQEGIDSEKFYVLGLYRELGQKVIH